MKVFCIRIILITLVTCVACNDYKLESRPYPSLDTEGVSDIGSDGATLHGKILAIGSVPVIDHGFVYSPDKDPQLDRGEIVSLGKNPGEGEFTGRADRSLDAGQKCYYRAFAMTANKVVVYGQVKTFESGGSISPVITSVTPSIGYTSDTVLIVGAGFSTYSIHNDVLFGIASARILQSLGGDSIICTVPALIPGSFDVKVVNNNREAIAPTKFTVPEITLSSFTPSEVTFGDTVLINGSNFPSNQASTFVILLGRSAPIIKFTPNQLKAVVPDNVTKIESSIDVTSGLLTVSSETMIKLRAPEISSFAPTSGSTDTEVTISGLNFSPVSQNNKVTINDVDATVLTSANKTLKIKIPELSPGNYTITVTILGQSSTSVETFEVE